MRLTSHARFGEEDGEDRSGYPLYGVPVLTLHKTHWVRDVTFDEDRSQVRTGAAPQVMAAMRNLVLALLHRAGHANIAAALRTSAGRPAAAVTLILSGGRK